MVQRMNEEVYRPVEMPAELEDGAELRDRAGSAEALGAMPAELEDGAQLPDQPSSAMPAATSAHAQGPESSAAEAHAAHDSTGATDTQTHSTRPVDQPSGAACCAPDSCADKGPDTREAQVSLSVTSAGPLPSLLPG